MQGAQKEAFEKLYAAEFNRYLTGKIVGHLALSVLGVLTFQSAHARFCMEHYLSWQDRGDLATVYCKSLNAFPVGLRTDQVIGLVDPRQPDQPVSHIT